VETSHGASSSSSLSHAASTQSLGEAALPLMGNVKSTHSNF
jgi:hypothetical protein